jgi:hypothetical protein
MGTIEQDVTWWPFLHKLAEVMPVADLAFGGVMLIVVMLAPIIAMSALFTFGWSCAMPVDLVTRCLKTGDAALANGARDT